MKITFQSYLLKVKMYNKYTYIFNQMRCNAFYICIFSTWVYFKVWGPINWYNVTFDFFFSFSLDTNQYSPIWIPDLIYNSWVSLFFSILFLSLVPKSQIIHWICFLIACNLCVVWRRRLLTKVLFAWSSSLTVFAVIITFFYLSSWTNETWCKDLT